MKKWTISDKTEFEARQGCFEFGELCRFVNDLIVSVKNKITAYKNIVVKTIAAPKKEEKKPVQMALNFLSWMKVCEMAV